MSFAQILPLAFVMIAGPQIISSFFFATSEGWAKKSLAYVAGAAVSVTTVVTIAYLASHGAHSGASSDNKQQVDRIIESIVLVLVLFLIARVYVTRGTTEPPKWMGRLEGATPSFAFKLGVLLLGVFPTDIATAVSAGLHVGRAGDSWWHCLPFDLLTLTLLGLPAIAVLFLGRRAEKVLPKIRDWMSDNSWVVSEVVLVFFAVIAINSLVSA